jgi:hypothetical protein
VAITFLGSASNPADNSSQAGPGPNSLTPVASMAAEDVALVWLTQRVAGADTTFNVNNKGGQFWHELITFSTTNLSMALVACRFNGTWSANPTFENTGGSATPLTVKMDVFRPSAGKRLDIDVWPLAAAFAAGSTPFTKNITGITTLTAGAVAVAAWASVDANTYGTLTSGWSNAGGSQIRNSSGSQTSISTAYQVFSTAGATGNVSENQATLGGDAGASMILALSERNIEFSAVPDLDVLWDGENSTNGTTLTAAIMNAATHVNGSIGTWALVTGTPNLKVSTSGQKGFGTKSVKVAATSYTDSSGTRGMQHDHANQGAAAAYFAWTPTTSPNKMTLGCWATPGMNYLEFESYTVLGIQDSGAAGLSAFNIQNFDAAFQRTYLENADSTILPGPWLTKDTPYWIALLYDNTGAIAKMAIYDASFVQQGFQVVLTPGAAQQKPHEARIGSFGGGFPSHANFSYYDDLVVGMDTNAGFPVGPAAAASGTTITPSVGSLTTTGVAPTLVQGTVRTGLVGALVAAGVAAVIVRGTVTPPSVGSLALGGVAPALVQGTVRAPSNAALALTGIAPVVTQNIGRTPAVGALTIGSAAPTLQLANNIAPPAGALTLNGLQPSVVTPTSIAPATGALSLTGQAPTLSQPGSAQPQAGSLSFAGAAPRLDLGVPAPVPGTLSLTGQQPLVLTSFTIKPSVGSLSLSGLAPVIPQGVTITPTPGALSINGQLVQLNGQLALSPSTGALALAGQQPLVLTAFKITPNTGAIAAAGQPAQVGAFSIIVPGTGALAFVGQGPLANGQTNVPGTATVSLVGQAPIVISLERPSYRRLIVLGRLRVIELPEYP